MRTLTLVLLLAQGQAPGQEAPVPGPQGPAAADRAFAARAAEMGVNAAFLEVLSDDATLFYPHPVEGRVWMETHPEDGQLAWEPRAEAISRAGDLGVTLGSYTYSRGGATLSAGHYVSVWQRGGEEPWKLVADLGTPHAALAAEPPYARFALGPRPGDGGQERSPAEQEATVRKLEDGFAEVLAAGRDAGLASVFWADDHTVVLRPGAPPAFGQDPAAAQEIGAWQGGRRVRQGLERLLMARSADLAVTWGDLTPVAETAATSPAGASASGGWLRVWRLDPGARGWRILVDVVLPPQ